MINTEGPIKLVLEGCPIEDYKKARFQEIDIKTQNLIAEGFEFNGNTFSLSLISQFNINVIKNNKANFDYPLDVSTIDHNIYKLEKEEVAEFWALAFLTVKEHLQSGRLLKKQIFDCTTKEEAIEIIDIR